MTDQRNTPALHTEEVCVLGLDIVQDIENLRRLRWGSKRIARELGVARNTVQRYLRDPDARVQKRPNGAKLTSAQRKQAADPFNRDSDLDWIGLILGSREKSRLAGSKVEQRDDGLRD